MLVVVAESRHGIEVADDLGEELRTDQGLCRRAGCPGVKAQLALIVGLDALHHVDQAQFLERVEVHAVSEAGHAVRGREEALVPQVAFSQFADFRTLGGGQAVARGQGIADRIKDCVALGIAEVQPVLDIAQESAVEVAQGRVAPKTGKFRCGSAGIRCRREVQRQQGVSEPGLEGCVVRLAGAGMLRAETLEQASHQYPPEGKAGCLCYNIDPVGRQNSIEHGQQHVGSL